MTTTAPVMIALGALRFGHEATPPINARQVGRNDEIAPLAASIKAHGLGVALNVREIDGSYYVADGNRRLAALHLLREAGELSDDTAIKVDVGFEGDADELSLALNFERLDMHEADVYQKMHDLRSRGLLPDQIASRFGIAVTRVNRMLALGHLHPVILEAWRNNELRQPADVVKAFTVAPSQKAQKEVFDRLSKKGELTPYAVRQAFGAGDREAQRKLIFVGREAYVAAGGKLGEDLFGNDPAIANPELLDSLVDVRIQAESEKLTAAGWAWTDRPASVGQYYSWERLTPTKLTPTPEQKAELEALQAQIGKKRHWELDDAGKVASKRIEELQAEIHLQSFGPKQKAKAGCVLTVSSDGTLHIQPGLVKPTTTTTKAKGKAKDDEEGEGEPTEKAPAGVSNAMAQRLSVQVAHAVRKALPANPHTALAAVLAGMGTAAYGNPMMLRCEGNVQSRGEVEPFTDRLARFLEMPTDQLLEILARHAGDMVHYHTNFAHAPILDSAAHRALAEALDQDALQPALRECFDADDYFQTAPRAITQAAIADMLGADAAKAASKMKKDDLVIFAKLNLLPTGWLPPELRTTFYVAVRATPTGETPA